MAVEAPQNGLQTSLQSAILAGDSTCSLSSATGWTAAQYRCLITDGVNYEIVTTGGLSGTTLTITRATEAYAGTQTAYGFAAGSIITCVLTVESVRNLAQGGLASCLSYTQASNYTIAGTTIAAVDSSHLTVSVTVPKSGNVKVHLDCIIGISSASYYVNLFWVTHGTTTVVGKGIAFRPDLAASAVPTNYTWLFTGLTAGSTFAVDLAWCTSNASGTATLYPTAPTAESGADGGPVVIIAEAA